MPRIMVNYFYGYCILLDMWYEMRSAVFRASDFVKTLYILLFQILNYFFD